MPSDHVFQLCSSNETVIAALAAEPDQQINKIAKNLFKKSSKTTSKEQPSGGDELDRAAQCGKFPYRPSDLFLKVYNDVLSTLDADPLAGLVSPSLIGSSGVVPLSVVSVIPDIMRHYADLIVRAETEIFLATNYWENSHSAKIITDSLRELSKRAEARGGPRVIVKLMYDRGSPRKVLPFRIKAVLQLTHFISQVVQNHILVKPDAWEDPAVGLPNQKEMPFIDLEVVNYHRPIVGTFHAKYLVIDRKIACINSNNIQDRPNVEMCVHLEGPIVEGFYDMALMSWALAMHPPLPLLSKPPVYPEEYKFLHENESLKYIDPEFSSKATRKFINERHENLEQEDSKEVENRGGNHSDSDAIAQHPNMTVPTADNNQGRPVQALAREDEDIAHAARLSDENLVDTGAVQKITTHLNEGNSEATATTEDESLVKDFRPHILHQPHKPCPMAMVNRKPRGTPGHEDENKVPQNVAWLSAMRNAQQNIFIQTPTFNASPVIPAVLDACRRGVQVTLYLDLGFNDQGEMIPFQGGTNEEVINKMYKELNADKQEKHKNLKVYWYTAKDQSKPLSAAMKKRNCHVKFMAVDGQIAIFGNGNQDTQSWFHSQEINVMVDSRELVDEWVQGINANQNTAKFGRVSDTDGVWRDADGNVVEATGIKTAGPFGHLKGIGGAIARVRGTGGF